MVRVQVWFTLMMVVIMAMATTMADAVGSSVSDHTVEETPVDTTAVATTTPACSQHDMEVMSDFDTLAILAKCELGCLGFSTCTSWCLKSSTELGFSRKYYEPFTPRRS